MPGMQDDPDIVDFCEISPELSRNFRGLAVWLADQAVRPRGHSARNLDEKLDLAREAADAVRRDPGRRDRRRAAALALRLPRSRGPGASARGAESAEPGRSWPASTRGSASS